MATTTSKETSDIKMMRRDTLGTLGLGTVLDVFRNGRLPADPAELVSSVFGPAGDRGALVISGASGIVGAGKMMQLGARLEPFGVPIVGLDMPGAPDGISRQYPGLVRAFGKDGADKILGNMVRLTYDGKSLPDQLKPLRPKFLLEAIPEILEIKRAHYEMFRASYPDIQIRSVTSGFPASQLGVGIAHPAFPHEINKVFEVVEDEPSDVTKLFWALGLVPVPVSDDWSFVLDVLFCGITLAAVRYHRMTNTPVWKIDKYVRKHIGPNPVRAHDAIGAKGATFLTWSCLHHLAGEYGPLFEPTPEFVQHKDSGQDWYPPNHFRPVVDFPFDDDDEAEFLDWILGPLVQMTSLMLKEERAHLGLMNAMGELCAQFRRGILAMIRDLGTTRAIATVERYHKHHPEAAKGDSWYPAALERISDPEWQQLYVNAEHDGKVGVVTISRESYNGDVDAELNRAIDWLKAEKIDRVILTSDFHLSTQMVGADTNEFFPALDSEEEGARIAGDWSRTARRLDAEFAVSVGFVPGKRCLGGYLELMTHCHYLVTLDDTSLGFPEVTLPVVPGMEGCHWPFRKTNADGWMKLLQLLLTGRPVSGANATGWLVDFAGPMEEALEAAWSIASGGDHRIAKRELVREIVPGVTDAMPELPPAGSPATQGARAAIVATVRDACSVNLADSLDVQTRHAAGFLRSDLCRKGRVGDERSRTLI
ncbi:MAG: hypothetical protein KDA27_21210 [Candidatus Eisenbacteria bacterium]|uniref:Enoyl-CoA hydratase/isomerase family protein n=1 Tax=Eiseniibacteriota bacterium TaxID=2212470 RepID=A0A956NIF6_UNCEI|nr:hypothetical protein [Candidatus Eisenbacteria bacterium]